MAEDTSVLNFVQAKQKFFLFQRMCNLSMKGRTSLVLIKNYKHVIKMFDFYCFILFLIFLLVNEKGYLSGALHNVVCGRKWH